MTETEKLIRAQWLFALVELGLSWAEFNQLTPAEWGQIIKLWTEKQEREERRTCQLAWWVNLSCVPRKEGDAVPSLLDFWNLWMGRAEVAAPPERLELSGAELQQKFERLTNPPR